VKPDLPPPSNRLSDAPTAAAESGARDSMRAVGRMVQPDALSVVFQPVVRLDTGTVHAYEALVRCRQPEFRNPLVLFQQAVSMRCAGRLGRMIREIAVPLSSGQRLMLNVHPQELRESWLVRPDDPVFTHDHEVYLEVTESVPMLHFELCKSVLSEVRGRGGVHLVIDDLGAAESNLKSIVDLEPRAVKLDRELIAGVSQSTRQQRLVKRLVWMCAELGADVIAEGVETRDELATITDLGVRYAQGFLFARPGFPLPEVTWPPPSVPPSRR
jgi:EAL domain-containing protein (putative c-di-GMP-specific phosphodiesterase class I)